LYFAENSHATSISLPDQTFGHCSASTRLERGHFVWPVTDTGSVSLTPAQLSMLLEGIDWRAPQRVGRPELAG